MKKYVLLLLFLISTLTGVLYYKNTSPYNNSNSSRISTPVIKSISPESGPFGSYIIIKGSGFNTSGVVCVIAEGCPFYGNDVLLDGKSIGTSLSFDGTTIEFIFKEQTITPGEHKFSITHNSLKSNEIKFIVTSGSESNLLITSKLVDDASLGKRYIDSIEAIGGSDSDNYKWSVSKGALPPGIDLLKINYGDFNYKVRNLSLYGVPSADGYYTFTITVTSGNLSASKEFSITVRKLDY